MSHINAGTLQKNDTFDLYSHEITDLDIVSLPCRQNQWVYSSNRVDQSNPPYFQAEPGKVLSNRWSNVSKYSSNYSYPIKEYAERHADIYCSDQKQIRIMRRDQSPSRRGSSPSPNEMIPDNNTRKQYKKVTKYLKYLTKYLKYLSTCPSRYCYNCGKLSWINYSIVWWDCDCRELGVGGLLLEHRLLKYMNQIQWIGILRKFGQFCTHKQVDCTAGRVYTFTLYWLPRACSYISTTGSILFWCSDWEEEEEDETFWIFHVQKSDRMTKN